MIRLATAMVMLAAIAGFVLSAATASAQYPPPVGTVSESGPPTSDPGKNVTLSCVVRDANGNPIAGKAVTFDLFSNPGDTKLLTTTGTSDALGNVNVTLAVGSLTGRVGVDCVSETKTSSLVLEVLAEVSVIQPPHTGDAGLAAPRQQHDTLLIFAAIALLSFSATLVTVRNRAS